MKGDKFVACTKQNTTYCFIVALTFYVWYMKDIKYSSNMLSGLTLFSMSLFAAILDYMLKVANNIDKGNTTDNVSIT